MRTTICLFLLVLAACKDEPKADPQPAPSAKAPPAASSVAMPSQEELDKMLKGLGPMPSSGGLASIGPTANVSVAAQGASEQDAHDTLAMHDMMVACLAAGKPGTGALELSVDAAGKVTRAKATSADFAKSELSCIEDKSTDAHFSAGAARTVKIKLTHAK